jgi:hypothetical protein
MLWLLEAQARATWDVSIAAIMAAVSPLVLVVLCEALDQPAFGEIVMVGLVDLAPLAGSLLHQDRLLGAPFGVPTRWWLVAAFYRQGSDSFLLVLLVARLSTFQGGGLLGRVAPFGAALGFHLSGTLVH